MFNKKTLKNYILDNAFVLGNTHNLKNAPLSYTLDNAYYLRKMLP